MVLLQTTFLLISFVIPFWIIGDQDIPQVLMFALGNALIALAFLQAMARAAISAALLEPMPLFVCTQYLYFGPGTWPSAAGADMYVSNPGALVYYPLMSLAAGMGLLIYVTVYSATRTEPVLSDNRSGAPKKFSEVLLISTLGIVIYRILSAYMTQTTGFAFAGQGASGPLNWFGLTVHCFIFMAIGYIVLAWNKAWSFCKKGSLIVIILMNFLVLAGFVSRISLITAAILVFMIVVYRMGSRRIQEQKRFSGPKEGSSQQRQEASQRPRRLLSAFSGKAPHLLVIFLIAATGVIVAYVAGTRIKAMGMGAREVSGVERISEIISADVDESSVLENMSIDFGYRVNGIEFAAAIFKAQVEGTGWMWGAALFRDFLNLIPKPIVEYLGVTPRNDSERVIVDHYQLLDTDQNSSVLSSCVADFGILGVVAYFIMLALFHSKIVLSLYRGRSTLLAYLGTTPLLMRFDTDLGSQTFHYLKFFCFLWLCTAVLPAALGSMKQKRSSAQNHASSMPSKKGNRISLA